MKNLIITFVSIIFFLQSTYCNAQNSDWLQFRGENASGIAPNDATPPVEFNPDKNVLWKTSIPSGVSSPCICGNNIFITGFDSETKKYLVWNINRNDGSLNSEQQIAVDTFQKCHPVSSPAAATPASDGEFVYLFFPPYGVVCYDFDGNKRWEYPLEFHSISYGSGTSPIVYNNKFILNKASKNDARLIVLNKADGTLSWEKKLSSTANYSTPVIWKNQVILHRGGELIAYDLNDGTEKWKFETHTKGTATPVVQNDILYINTWSNLGEKALFGDFDDLISVFEIYDINNDNILSKKEFPENMVAARRPEAGDVENATINFKWDLFKRGDVDKNNEFTPEEWQGVVNYFKVYTGHGLLAIQMGDTGNISLTNQLWKVGENIPETPSVLCKNGFVYMVKNGGIVTCVNAKTGVVEYTERLGAAGSYFSSPLFAEGNIYVSSYNGVITVFKEGSKLEILSQNNLNEKIGASPVALEDKLYIRTKNHLYAFKE